MKTTAEIKTATTCSTKSSYDQSLQEIFHIAILREDCSQLKFILEEKRELVDLNLSNNQGQTALTQSCLKGNLELVRLLVSNGANVHLANREGWSPLHLAVFSGNTEIVSYLMKSSM